jgi:predicted RNase H-like HicB family nuclease
VIEADGSTNYSAYAPDLPGVVATGDTLEEAEAAMPRPSSSISRVCG